MRIEIDFSAANDPDARRWLDRILYRIEDGWHVWDTASQPNPNAIEAATWIRDRGPQGDRVRQMLVESIKRGAWTFAPHGRRVRVTARPNALDELKPVDAVRLADAACDPHREPFMEFTFHAFEVLAREGSGSKRIDLSTQSFECLGRSCISAGRHTRDMKY